MSFWSGILDLMWRSRSLDEADLDLGREFWVGLCRCLGISSVVVGCSKCFGRSVAVSFMIGFMDSNPFGRV